MAFFQKKSENIINQKQKILENKRVEREQLIRNARIKRFTNLNRNINSNNNQNNNKNNINNDNDDEFERQLNLVIQRSKEENEKELIKKSKEEEEEKKQIELAIKKSIEEEKKFKLLNKKRENYYPKNPYDMNINEYSFSDDEKKEEEEEKFDEEFGICPITQEYMKNPVLTPSGNYYEKSAIIDWLKTHNNDPLSREFLSVDMLVEDHDFKQKIIEYRRKFNK